MPDVALDVLTEGLELTDDDKRQLEAILSKGKNKEVVSDRYLMRQDYSRQTQDIQRQREEAERKQREADEYFASLSSYETDRVAEVEAAKQQQQAAMQQLAAYEKAMVDRGIDPKSLVGQQLLNQEASRIQQQPAFDQAAMDKRYIPMETARTIANAALMTPAELLDVQAKHRKYYGADAEVSWTEFVTEATKKLADPKNPQTFMQTAEEKFKFSEKQRELDAAALEVRAQQMADEKFQQHLEKMGVQTVVGVPPPPTSAVLQDSFSNITPTDAPPSPAQMRQAAVSHAAQVAAQLEADGVHMYEG